MLSAPSRKKTFSNFHSNLKNWTKREKIQHLFCYIEIKESKETGQAVFSIQNSIIYLSFSVPKIDAKYSAILNHISGESNIRKEQNATKYLLAPG